MVDTLTILAVHHVQLQLKLVVMLGCPSQESTNQLIWHQDI